MLLIPKQIQDENMENAEITVEKIVVNGEKMYLAQIPGMDIRIAAEEKLVDTGEYDLEDMYNHLINSWQEIMLSMMPIPTIITISAEGSC